MSELKVLGNKFFDFFFKKKINIKEDDKCYYTLDYCDLGLVMQYKLEIGKDIDDNTIKNLIKLLTKSINKNKTNV